MSSILTNNSAMVALQTLKSVNNDMSQVQEQISTGKKVNSAKDNAAIFAIASTMESDMSGIKSVQDTLSLGQSSVSTARNATDEVTKKLTEIKDKIILASDDSTDSTKIQAEIDSLTSNITTIVDSAQFNGVNLLKDDGNSYNVLSSLNRGSDGTVTRSDIAVAKQDLQIGAETAPDFTGAAIGAGVAGEVTSDSTALASDGSAATTVSFEGGGANIAEGDAFQITLTGSGANNLFAGQFEYVAGANDTLNDVTANLAKQINAAASEAGIELTATASNLEDTTDASNDSFITLSAAGGVAGTDDFSVAVDTATGQDVGGLSGLSGIDVTTDVGRAAALDSIEEMIQVSISASAAFGASETTIENQSDFLGKLTDSLKTGVGSLVDADMEEVSARLTALQTQQQLGVQSLSIANSGPQALLSLFR